MPEKPQILKQYEDYNAVNKVIGKNGSMSQIPVTEYEKGFCLKKKQKLSICILVLRQSGTKTNGRVCVCVCRVGVFESEYDLR